MLTAQVSHLLDPDPVRALDLIHARLKEETVFGIGGILAARLRCFAGAYPDLVDQVVHDAALGPWLEPSDDEGAHVDGLALNGFIGVVLFLALCEDTPNARALAGSWFEEPTASRICHRALLRVKGFLIDDDAKVRERAAALLLTAATAAEEIRVSAEPDSEGLGKAFSVASKICATVRRSCENHRARSTRVSGPPEGVLADVLPILSELSRFREPSIVHDAVQTFAVLAPQDPRAVLGCLRGMVDVGDPYAYDSLAQEATIALCARYLAEFWEDVMDVPDSLTALREVIGVFVRAGWPEAIGLSRRLGEAFR
ncbi:hypothetical protein ACFVWN_08805 [Nocardiopsis flavescens]|uniref:hypothetical protein n=1 Tax=Nocardiopsis flavescens TaxID=758803 RepID=UPI00364AAF91